MVEEYVTGEVGGGDGQEEVEDIEFVEDDDEEEGAVGGDDAAEKC